MTLETLLDGIGLQLRLFSLSRCLIQIGFTRIDPSILSKQRDFDRRLRWRLTQLRHSQCAVLVHSTAFSNDIGFAK